MEFVYILRIRHDLHFDKGVRVAVGVHGCQMGAAYDPDQQAALLCVVAQWHQDSTALGTEKNSRVRHHTCFQAWCFCWPFSECTTGNPGTAPGKQPRNNEIANVIKLVPENRLVLICYCCWYGFAPPVLVSKVFKLKIVIKGLIWAWTKWHCSVLLLICRFSHKLVQSDQKLLASVSKNTKRDEIKTTMSGGRNTEAAAVV